MMISKIYLLFIAIGSALSWIAWFFILFNTDPTEATGMVIVFFYLALSMGILGTYLILAFLLYRFIIKEKENFFEFFKKNIFQAFIATGIGTIILVLFHLKLMLWWNALLLILTLIVLKICLSFNKKYV